ncbi:hypothetical protein ACIOHH_37830 [Streptomyces microflavus]|uniref:hypothetical protein n=1 Tax=Streptomyces microflavus TaxID=1919 RepID=UPI003822F5F4
MRQWFTNRTAGYWRELVTLAFSLLAGIRAIQSFHSGNWELWQTLLVSALTFLCLASYRQVWSSERRNSPAVVGSGDTIARANYAWLKQPGRMVVLTRDMSWFLDSASNGALKEKAESGELTLLVAVESANVRQLASLGAEIINYGSFGFTPKVRCTILRYGASDSKILIHKQKDGKIFFYESIPEDFPDYWLAQDLVDSIISFSRTRGTIS